MGYEHPVEGCLLCADDPIEYFDDQDFEEGDAGWYAKAKKKSWWRRLIDRFLNRKPKFPSVSHIILYDPNGVPLFWSEANINAKPGDDITVNFKLSLS